MDIFIHIPKTGGSTVQGALSLNYDANLALRIEGPNRSEVLRSYGKSYQKNDLPIPLVYGHFPFGSHLFSGSCYRYFTFLRNPISRLISEYFYARSWNGHRFHNEIKAGELSLEKFLLSSHWFTGNILTAYLSGVTGVGRSRLEYAKLNILHNIHIFGLTERFDESMLLVGAYLGWVSPFYRKYNVTKGSPEHIDLKPSLLRQLESKLYYDISLYNFCCDVFEERIAQVRSLLNSSLSELVSQQDLYGDSCRDESFSEYNLKHKMPIQFKCIQNFDSIHYALLKDHVQSVVGAKFLGRAGMVTYRDRSIVSGWVQFDFQGSTVGSVDLYRNGTILRSVAPFSRDFTDPLIPRGALGFVHEIEDLSFGDIVDLRLEGGAYIIEGGAFVIS